MAKTALSEKRRKSLALFGDTEGAMSYGEWLGGRTVSDGGLERRDAEAEARRSDVGYGVTGERLAERGLADDGYAAYLRRAAREARSARTAAIEAERESRDLAALRGYAEYLEGEREAYGERLVSLAEELVSSPLSREEAEWRIALANVSPEATAALRNAYRYEGSRATDGEPKVSEAKVLDYLKKVCLPYDRAYRYCLDLGYSATDATRLAKEAEASYSEERKRLHALFSK